jgi:sugar phosphate isomerase/epimerase
MNPRLAVNSLSTATWTLEQDLDLYAALGVRTVALYFDKLAQAGVEKAVARVRDADLRTVHLFTRGFELHDPSTWPEDQARLRTAVDVALELGAPWLGITSGVALGLTWDEAADALGRALEPVRRPGVGITVEQTLPIRPEVGFVHSLRDSFELATRLELGATMECNYCFGERDLATTVAANVGRLATVQISDLVVPSTVVPDRAVPGDGVIPLRDLLALAFDAGYDGPVEIEQLGPRIEAEGYENALVRAIDAADELLDALAR